MLDIFYFAHKQWGAITAINNTNIYFNISFNNNLFGICGMENNAENASLQFAGINLIRSNKNYFNVYTSGGNNMGLFYISIGF